MISGSPSYGNLRVLAHYASGKLTIQDLSLTGGHVTHYSPSYSTTGGCVVSTGDVELDNVKVTSCYAFNLGSVDSASGGAIYTAGTLTLNSSTVTGSHVLTTGITGAFGGGVWAGGTVTMNNYSAVGFNYAKSTAGRAFGGGVFTQANATLTKSSVYYNQVSSKNTVAAGGGVYTHGDFALSPGAAFHNTSYSSYSYSMGGGVYAKGNASVSNSYIKYNSASSGSYRAYGGGASVRGGFTLTSSQMFKNSVGSLNPYSRAFGGGARVLGNVFATYSTIRDNVASGPGLGGGLYLAGSLVTINGSTISGNLSEGSSGGIAVLSNGAPGSSFQISSSTISGNHSSGYFGGLYVDSAQARFYNATIAFNTATSGGPGVALQTNGLALPVTLQSTLMSNNVSGTSEDDVEIRGGGSIAVNNGNLAALANNLIRATPISHASFPGDTKFGFCPHLGPLRANGGPTPTHALLSHSIAIDNGNVNFGGILYDQRGFDYARISGPMGAPNPKPDIGAYEVQQNDIIYNTDFETCNP
jgi:hypothetical protein